MTDGDTPMDPIVVPPDEAPAVETDPIESAPVDAEGEVPESIDSPETAPGSSLPSNEPPAPVETPSSPDTPMTDPETPSGDTSTTAPDEISAGSPTNANPTEPASEDPSPFEITISVDPERETTDVHVRYDTGRVLHAEHGEGVPDPRHVTETVNAGGVKMHPPELLADQHAAGASDDLTRVSR